MTDIDAVTADLASFAAWHLARRGHDLTGDLLGDDRPARTAAFCADTLARLRG